MNCNRFLSFFSAYLEGELGESVVSSIEAHLDKCKKCSRLVSAYTAGAARLREPGELEVPKDLFQRVKSAAEEKESEPRVIPLKSPRYMIPAAAAALLAMVFSFSLFQPGKDSFSLEKLAEANPTMYIVDLHFFDRYSHSEMESRSSGAASKVSYRSDFDFDDLDGEVVLSYGVSHNPVIILSGVSQVNDR